MKSSSGNPQGEPLQTLREATPKCQLQKNSAPGVLRVEFALRSSLWVIVAVERWAVKEAVFLGREYSATPCRITNSSKVLKIKIS